MPLTFDELLSRKKPVTKVVDIVMDPALAEELEEARQERERAHGRAQIRPDDGEVQARFWEAEEKVLALERRIEEEQAVAYFTFQAIGRAAYDAIVAAHPAGAEQKAKMRRMGLTAEMANNVNWDEATFPPAIVAACLVSIELPDGAIPGPYTEEQMTKLWQSQDFNQAELSKLVIAAIQVNGTARTADLGKGSRKTQLSVQS